MLFQQNHFLRVCILSGIEAVEVDSGSYAVTGCIKPVPGNGVAARFRGTRELSYEFPGDVINSERPSRLFG